MTHNESTNTGLNRRRLLQAVGAASLGAMSLPSLAQAEDEPSRPFKGRIKQSIAQWCFAEHFSLPELAKIAVKLRCPSIELVDPKEWGVLKEHDLVCGITFSHGFQKGMNNPEHWEECLEKLRDAIDATSAAGFPNVITFTGMAGDISDEDGIKNCVAGYKKIIGYAEKKKVNLCLEMLNTRDDTHPMKGHPGYQGNHLDYCMDIIKQVGSERMKLLFDIYHVQIMDGDVIRRLHELKDYLGHIHTAGNPGRGELDDNQEINYPPIMRTLVEIGYKGYVGQEFIPTRDAFAGLQQAVELCDV